MEKYLFHKSLMLRTPALSYQNYRLSNLSQLFDIPGFKAALFLANPPLYRLIALKSFDWGQLSAKEKLSLIKYYNRMSFRPTPFGTFSAFTMVNWGKADQIKLSDRLLSQLHLNFDQELAVKIYRIRNKARPDTQAITINPTLYLVDKEFRFIKSSLAEGSKHLTFSLESLGINPLLEQLLKCCKNDWITVLDLVPKVTAATGCTEEIALDYIHFLLNAQWLVYRSRPHIIGEDYITTLANCGALKDFDEQGNFDQLLRQLSKSQLTDDIQLEGLSRQVNNWLITSKQLPVANLFYAGLERKAIAGCVDESLQGKLKDVLAAVNFLSGSREYPALNQFIEQFSRKFDQRKVPLLEALDPYTGVGYAGLENDQENPLLEELRFKHQSPSPKIAWSGLHQFLLTHWMKGGAGNRGIVLTKKDVEALTVQLEPASPSFSLMFRHLAGDAILLEAIGGGSATTLIGRFSYWSEDSYAVARELAKMEEGANRGVIFAELAQLSDLHADNINRRGHFYSYEIPINTASVLPKENQVLPEDLWLSVRNGKLILESLSLQKVVIPRLSSAYNYARNELALFRLLCDLQYQDINVPAIPDLEQFFPGLTFYPRLSYENTILSLAKWRLTAVELSKLTVADNARSAQYLMELRETLALPDMVSLVRHDQQLVINLNNPPEAALFLQTIKGASEIHLQEFLFPSECRPVTDQANKSFVHQYVAFLYRKDELYKAKPVTLSDRKMVKQSEFMLGSKWLYLKLYCNPAISNQLITRKLLPVIYKLKQMFGITWFFIRFRDEGYHIRLRIKTSEKHIGHIVQLLKRRLMKDVRLQLVREYLTDTYRPEWERYGPDLMNQVENLFGASSELIAHYLNETVKVNFKLPYHSLAFVSVMEMIELFIPELAAQVIFLDQMAASFYREFSDDKLLKVDLNEKYRELKIELKQILSDLSYYKNLRMVNLHIAFANQLHDLVRNKALTQERRKHELLSDLIHMHLNRLFVDDQRKQELVVYYCLWKYKLTEKAIKR